MNSLNEDIISNMLLYLNSYNCCKICDIFNLSCVSKNYNKLSKTIKIKNIKYYQFNKYKLFANQNICLKCDDVTENDVKQLIYLFNHYLDYKNDTYNLAFRQKWDKNFTKYTYFICSEKISSIDNFSYLIKYKTNINIYKINSNEFGYFIQYNLKI